MTDDTTTPPICVQPNAAPIVTSESFRVMVVAALGFGADKCLHSDLAIGAVIAAGGILASWLWGVGTRLHTWRKLKLLANLLPDDKAVVGKAP